MTSLCHLKSLNRPNHAGSLELRGFEVLRAIRITELRPQLLLKYETRGLHGKKGEISSAAFASARAPFRPAKGCTKTQHDGVEMWRYMDIQIYRYIDSERTYIYIYRGREGGRETCTYIYIYI